MRSPDVAVVVPCWNSERWLPGCLAGLARQTFRAFSTTLVDNGSTDRSVELARALDPGVQVLRSSVNRGFAAAVNTGIGATDGTYVVLLNVDTVPEPTWLQALVETMERQPAEVGSVASLMLSLDDPTRVDNAGDVLTRQGAARKRGHGEPASRFTEPTEILSACAGAALYRRSFLEAVGGFDERFFAYLEDVDLGLRGQLLGYRCVYVPAARILHQGHGSGLPRGRYVRLITRNRLMLLAKNLPGRLLLRHLPHLLYGQVYFLVAYRRPLHSLAGGGQFLAALPHVLRARRRILGRPGARLDALDRFIARDLGEPPLLRSIAAKLWGRTA